MKETGLIHIYTGNGKGKTTSAVGLTARALGHGFKVCYAYFHKEPEKYGYTELENLKKLGANVLGFAKGHPFCNKEINGDSLKPQAEKALETLRDLLQKDHYDMLVMDEILISVRDGYLEEEKLLDFVKNKPSDLELVMTGRGATDRLIELADYVSEVQKIKHPYDHMITSREGIEY